MLVEAIFDHLNISCLGGDKLEKQDCLIVAPFLTKHSVVFCFDSAAVTRPLQFTERHVVGSLV